MILMRLAIGLAVAVTILFATSLAVLNELEVFAVAVLLIAAGLIAGPMLAGPQRRSERR